jgi:hypothetical protein
MQDSGYTTAFPEIEATLLEYLSPEKPTFFSQAPGREYNLQSHHRSGSYISRAATWMRLFWKLSVRKSEILRYQGTSHEPWRYLRKRPGVAQSFQSFYRWYRCLRYQYAFVRIQPLTSYFEANNPQLAEYRTCEIGQGFLLYSGVGCCQKSVDNFRVDWYLGSGPAHLLRLDHICLRDCHIVKWIWSVFFREDVFQGCLIVPGVLPDDQSEYSSEFGNYGAPSQ